MAATDRGGELAHGSDAVGMRQLALYLAILSLATSALQGNGGLPSEVAVNTAQSAAEVLRRTTYADTENETEGFG